MPVAGVDVHDTFDSPGRGQLDIVRRTDRSIVTRAFARSPLRLLIPSNHGRAAWIYTSHYGGGLVDGDQVQLEISIGRHAAAFLSTQASTKVYRSPHGTSALLHARIDSDGLLIVAPDPVVCFADARYRQVQRFHVAERGALVVLDWLAAGRCAAGERWAFSEYRSLLEVTLDRRRLVYDAIALRQADGPLRTRMGRFAVLAVAIVIGDMFAAEAAKLLSECNDEPVRRRPDQLVSACALGEAGCLLRVAGPSVESVGRTLRRALAFIPRTLGDDPWGRKF
jgi:urease accessory protein